MKILKTISVFILVLSFSACGQSGDKTQTTVEKEVEVITQDGETETYLAEDLTAEECKALIEKGNLTIVDVRTPEECAGGMIEGAINIDFRSDDFKAKMDELDKTKPVLVYCAAGGRSGKTKDMLHDMKFNAVYNLLGGYGNWPYKN